MDTSELAPGLVLGQVQAKDRDAGINGIVRYRIRTMDSQDPEDPFHYFGNYLKIIAIKMQNATISLELHYIFDLFNF